MAKSPYLLLGIHLGDWISLFVVFRP